MTKPRVEDETKAPGAYASPPCYMHELDPLYLGLEADPAQFRDVARWRSAERERLLAARLAIPAETGARLDAAIAARLEALIRETGSRTVGLYWPVRGEPDLRSLMSALCARGFACALPVATSLNAPLQFRLWRPDAVMQRDALDVPSPADAPETDPDILIVPALAFDRSLHRLGNGDGLIDRTLVAMARRPRAIAVSYAEAELATIYPQPTDIRMYAIVTEREVIGGLFRSAPRFAYGISPFPRPFAAAHALIRAGITP